MKYLSYEGLQYLYSKILTRLGLKVDASGGDISSTKISAFDTVSTEFPVPAAGENTKTVFGKIKKFITDFNSLKSSLLLLSMLTSQYENNTSKIPTAALVYALKQSLDATNSNLNNKASVSALNAVSTDVQNIKSGTIAAGQANNIVDYSYHTPISIAIQNNNLYINDGNKIYYVPISMIQ